MKDILKKIIPCKEEEDTFRQVAADFIRKIKIKGAQVILGGSGAKGTWLSNNHDIDIYVLFDYQKYAKQSAELAELLFPVLTNSFPVVNRLHGSRDYFQVKYNNYLFEVVPILNIRTAEEAKNITDISPLHAEWVNKNCKNKDEVRLAKQFFRANSLYGAESHILGFSGYVLEILIAYYGTFEKLLKACLRWKDKEVIDVEKQYSAKNALFSLNKSKTVSPLIVIDPVDKRRNAAAALSAEKLLSLQKIAKQYFKKKSEDFFVKKEISKLSLMVEAKKKKLNLVHVEVQPLPGKEDIIGVKLLKAFNFLQKGLEEFELKKSGWDFNQFYFLVGKKELPKFTERPGPPLKLKEFVADFKKKNKYTFIRGGKIFAKIKVEHPRLDDFVKHLLQDKYVLEKVKGMGVVEII